LLGASGVETSPEELSPQVFLPGREGSLQLELVAATRRAGRIPYQVDGAMDALLGELAAGRPVLVLQNLGTTHFPRWHYAVLTGFHGSDNEVVLNTGTSEGKRQSARSFARTWAWAGNWGLVALRPGELPGQPDPQRFAESVAAFEQVAGFEAAEPSWRAMAERWPDDWRPLLAMGNAAYRDGELDGAIRHYRRALTLAPGSPVLENNLATVLAEYGCPDAARTRLQPVYDTLGSDSPWRGDLEATLHELELFRHPDQPHCPGA
jgi:tetratricopeptide (TPR) repeat protein